MGLIPESPLIDPWYDVSERAKVRIMSDEVGGVTGILAPDSITFSYAQRYNPAFGSLMSSFNTGLVAMQQYLAKGGKVVATAYVQELQDLVWGGATNLSFSMTLLYVARRGSRLDVVAPIKRLIKMSASGVGTRFKDEKSKRTNLSATMILPPPKVSIEVGEMVSIKRAVIENVSINFPNSVTDLRGNPNEAKVTLSIKTQRVFLADDEDVVFMGGVLNT